MVKKSPFPTAVGAALFVVSPEHSSPVEEDSKVSAGPLLALSPKEDPVVAAIWGEKQTEQ